MHENALSAICKDCPVDENIREWERNRILPKHLVTIKKASEITGSSTSFFKQLIREKELTRYKINTATFASLIEFEHLAIGNVNDKK